MNRRQHSLFQGDLSESVRPDRFKLTAARKVGVHQGDLDHSNDSGTDTLPPRPKVLEDGADTAEESMNQLASRQMKFIQQLENAQVRIKTVLTVCIGTGSSSQRSACARCLTQHSISKMARH
jgi:hypothetical protein